MDQIIPLAARRSGPLRGQVQYGMRPGTLTGNSPFTPVKGPENMQAGVFALGGTLALLITLSRALG